MADDTGIFQHAIFNVPNFAEGYCTDDNARAFILTLLLEETTSLTTQRQLERLAGIYLGFLWHAFDQKTCRFQNFMSYQRDWLEPEGSEDSHARALWATGTALGRLANPTGSLGNLVTDFQRSLNLDPRCFFAGFSVWRQPPRINTGIQSATRPF